MMNKCISSKDKAELSQLGFSKNSIRKALNEGYARSTQGERILTLHKVQLGLRYRVAQPSGIQSRVILWAN